MRIVGAEIFPLRIPFTDGSAGVGLMPSRWTHLDVVLLCLRADDGTFGWGEGFAYGCRTATIAALNDMVLSLVQGQEIGDIAEFNIALQKRLHLQGRYGITMFAISAVDIALWDIASKQAGVSLADLVGGTGRARVPAYASLVRYGEPNLVRDYVAKAVEEGYGTVKLHEIALPAIEAGHLAISNSTRLVTDVNCNWSRDEAENLLPEMRRMGLFWVEEPVFPPDNVDLLADLQARHGVAIASGENLCTAAEFARSLPKIAFSQPSVTKLGGISEFLAVCDLAKRHAKTVMPHAPYFGPGYWATVQLMAARPCCELLEFLYIEPEAWLDPSIPLPQAGMVTVPEGPGLGFNPDPALLQRFAA